MVKNILKWNIYIFFFHFRDKPEIRELLDPEEIQALWYVYLISMLFDFFSLIDAIYTCRNHLDSSDLRLVLIQRNLLKLSTKCCHNISLVLLFYSYIWWLHSSFSMEIILLFSWKMWILRIIYLIFDYLMNLSGFFFNLFLYIFNWSCC